nr:hypothetical protein [Actinacidiphila oryziradicis]
MDTYVHENPTRTQDPGCLAQHCRVAGHVGVDHHRDRGRDGIVADRQPFGIGLRDRERIPGAGRFAGGSGGLDAPAEGARHPVDAGMAPEGCRDGQGRRDSGQGEPGGNEGAVALHGGA